MKTWVIKDKIPKEKIVNVVSISSVAMRGIADGKNIPILFLDIRDEIENAIENHGLHEQGDLKTTWARKSRSNISSIILNVELLRPTECNIYIIFDLKQNAIAVDQIINAQACWIASSRDGNTFAETSRSPKMLLEVRSNHIRESWNDIYYKAIVRMFRKSNISKKKARIMARDFIDKSKGLSFTL